MSIGDEMAERVVGIGFNAGKTLTVGALMFALKKVLKLLKLGANPLMEKNQVKKTSVKTLEKGGDTSTGLEVSKAEIGGFHRYAKKYNLDYCIKRDRNDPTRYVLMFKQKDMDKLELCIKEFVGDKSRDNNSLADKIQEAKERAMNFNKAREQTKSKSRGRAKGKEL